MGKNTKIFRKELYFFYIVLLLIAIQACAPASRSIILSCNESNDLYKALKENRIACIRYDTPTEAIYHAGTGAGVLIMADGYPEKTTEVDSLLFEKAKDKNLRVYIEFPSYLPGAELGTPMKTKLERAVISSDVFSPSLNKFQVLVIHGCHYVPIRIENPDIVIARVAGFDHAVYGLPDQTFPVLGKVHQLDGQDNLMVSTTKLSQFIAGRYAPQKAMQAVWAHILRFVEGEEAPVRNLEWTPDVRTSYIREQKLPANAASLAVQRGMDWYTNSKMLLSEQGWEEYKQLWNLNDSNILATSDGVIDIAAPQPKSQAGDGSFGVLEGIVSEIQLDGSQPTRWWLRSDCNGESSLAFALRWQMDGDNRSKLVAGNLLDWLYFKSELFQNNPDEDNYGLLFWATGNEALYQDNDIKAILSCMGTSALINTDRWDGVLVKNILGNFRTTGINGFRGSRLENPDLLRNGWQSYWNRNRINLRPHYEAWIWASYLWLYDKTKWEPLLKKTEKAIRLMMEAYPDDWKWTNGIQQERGRMLLPLAWLIRVDDRPEYREWLKQIADDIEKCQDESGAIREELGALDRGKYKPPGSNEEYGTKEAPLIQKSGDCVTDLLYTCNFTFLGLHEAYAATGDKQYKRMADKLTEFLIRVQIKSEKHSNLDGGWFRAFDYRQWEYFGANADAGWGAWCIETGWTQAWISAVLAMRELNKNLWEITLNSEVNHHFEHIRKQMIPDEVFVK